jgi:hypothetical protein
MPKIQKSVWFLVSSNRLSAFCSISLIFLTEVSASCRSSLTVEKHGTKLQKLMLEALKQKDYKKAIALWQDIVTIANSRGF